jgi:hypothetical protein
MAEYRVDNKEKIHEDKKKYRETNIDKIKEGKKKYRENNKEKIKEYREKQYTCECGSTLCLVKKSSHNKTKKHINYIESTK